MPKVAKPSRTRRESTYRVPSGNSTCSRRLSSARGRRSIKDKAVSQQYLTPQEEKALVSHALHMSSRGWPVPIKLLRNLALVIRHHRTSLFQIPSEHDGLKPPGKNWPQGFYKRHPELKALKVKALDWKRHERSIHDKVTEWFAIIGEELSQPGVLQENVYNMDETGILLSVLNSIKVLVGRDEARKHRGAGVQRTLITAIECISADGRALNPLIIWPASTHRSTWTSHPTPGWHFACSPSGYTDSAISLYWVKHVFDPLTRVRAGGRPRVLISDGFGTHETVEVMQYCFENNIILCRLPSHTSHKLQPCDVGVFGPLKAAYREEVERLYRGGSNTIGKQHFTLLYSRARTAALTARNIRASWSKAGLHPFNPVRVLQDTQPAPVQGSSEHTSFAIAQPSPASVCSLRTPTTYTSFGELRHKVESKLGELDERSKAYLQKLWNASEKVFADRAMLFDENKLLFDQNNEKTVRNTTKSTVVGRAKVMRYEDIMEAQKKREEKKGRRCVENAGTFTVPTARMMSVVDEEMLKAKQEFEAMDMAGYCSILQC